MNTTKTEDKAGYSLNRTLSSENPNTSLFHNGHMNGITRKNKLHNNDIHILQNQNLMNYSFNDNRLFQLNKNKLNDPNIRTIESINNFNGNEKMSNNINSHLMYKFPSAQVLQTTFPLSEICIYVSEIYCYHFVVIVFIVVVF